MPDNTLYQNELRNNLIELNNGVEVEKIDNLIRKTNSFIEQTKKYFPNDYLEIFCEITKESPNFEEYFNVIINSLDQTKEPLLIFIPAMLCDMCFSNESRSFIEQTRQELIHIAEDLENFPDSNGLYSRIRDVHMDDGININARSRSNRAQHSINTGGQLIEYLRSYIDLEKEELETRKEQNQQRSDWVKRVSGSIASQEFRKNVNFVESFTQKTR